MAGGNAGAASAARVLFSLLGLVLPLLVAGDDPYRFFTWTVTYGDIYPLGVKQQVRYYTTTLVVLCRRRLISRTVSEPGRRPPHAAKEELAEAVVNGIGLFVCRGS